MAYEIREMAFAEVLDSAFQLLRDHFVLLVGTSAITLVPVQLGILLFPRVTLRGAGAIVVGALLILIISPFVRALQAFVIGELYLGRSVSLGQAYGKILRIFFPLTGTIFLSSLAIMGATLLLVVPGIYFGLAFVLINQVMVFERTFGAQALSRSRELMQGNFLRAIGILLLEVVMSWTLTFGVGLALRLVPWPWLHALAAGISASVASAFGAAALVVLYFEIRCRKEAFDLEHLARLVEVGDNLAAAPTA
jgi:hypothetical protein